MVSGLLFGGEPGKLVLLWKGGNIQPLISREILDAYLRVLACPKFKLSQDDLNYILHYEILPYFEIVSPRAGPVIVQADRSDDNFLRCAQFGKAKVVISGDQDLLSLESYGKIQIVTASHFLKSRK